MARFEHHPDRRPAIVAGASSGIGAATATELAAHGFPVALGARRVEKCQELVEETLRYDASSHILARLVTEDQTYYDTTVPAGDVLVLLIGSANRDERAFENPDEYRIDREIGPKLVSFGSGAHFCLGAHLARMEARVALTELFKRIRGYEVDEANAVRVHSSSVRGFAHLPIAVSHR